MEEKNISDLKFDPRNARRRTERSSYMIRRSLEKFGGMRSIVIDDKNIVRAGNGTLEEAGQLGIDRVRIIEADGSELIAVRRKGLSEDDWKEYAIADNRSSDLSEWDVDVLQETHNEVDLSDWFTRDEISAWDVEGEYETPSDEEDEETTSDLIDQVESGEIEPRVKLGEIWALGRHRIACGDSTDEANVKKLLGDRTPSFVWSDPPYGIAIVATNGYVGGGEANNIPFGGVKNETPQQRAKRLGSANGSKPFGSKDVRGSVGASNVVEVNKYAPIIGDESIDTAVKAYETAAAIAPKAMHVWWGGNYYSSELPNSNCWIVWDKENTGNFADAELAWTNSPTAVRIFKHMWNGMVKASEHGQKRVHPTQKPIALAEWCFEKYGNDGDVILDQFLGSGMSIIAAQKMEGDRTVYGFELSPEYCTVIIERFEKFTGKNAELVGYL